MRLSLVENFWFIIISEQIIPYRVDDFLSHFSMPKTIIKYSLLAKGMIFTSIITVIQKGGPIFLDYDLSFYNTSDFMSEFFCSIPFQINSKRATFVYTIDNLTGNCLFICNFNTSIIYSISDYVKRHSRLESPVD